MQIPVTFRIDKNDPTVTAVFVSRETHPTNGEAFRVCYAHVGQHAECALAWAREFTRAATLDEYASLLRELQQIYDTEGDALTVQAHLP